VRSVLALVRREVQAYFVSPIAYAFMTVFLVLVGGGFLQGLFTYALIPPADAQARGIDIQRYMIAGPRGLVLWCHAAMLFSLPGLAMRLFSEEKKTGTAELLFTSPLTTAQLVVGKYLGTLSVFFIMLVLTFPLIGILEWKASPELGATAAAYLGLFLLGGVMIAVGLFASCLTENQFVALILTYAMLTPFYLLDLAIRSAGAFLAGVMADLSVSRAIPSFGRGVIDSHYVVLEVCVSFLFLFLGARVLESARWR